MEEKYGTSHPIQNDEIKKKYTQPITIANEQKKKKKT